MMLTLLRLILIVVICHTDHWFMPITDKLTLKAKKKAHDGLT